MTALSRFKTWHAGLSKTAKIVLWSVTAVLAGSAINAAASPNGMPITSTSKPDMNQATQNKPVVTTKTVTETSEIPFTSTTVDDSSLAKGKTEVRIIGINGVKTSTYEVTYTDGAQTAKKLVKEETTAKPINEVIAVGTYVAVKHPKPRTLLSAARLVPLLVVS